MSQTKSRKYPPKLHYRSFSRSFRYAADAVNVAGGVHGGVGGRGVGRGVGTTGMGGSPGGVPLYSTVGYAGTIDVMGRQPAARFKFGYDSQLTSADGDGSTEASAFAASTASTLQGGGMPVYEYADAILVQQQLSGYDSQLTSADGDGSTEASASAASPLQGGAAHMYEYADAILVQQLARASEPFSGYDSQLTSAPGQAGHAPHVAPPRGQAPVGGLDFGYAVPLEDGSGAYVVPAVAPEPELESATARSIAWSAVRTTDA